MGQRALVDKPPPRLFVNTDMSEVRQRAFGTGCKCFPDPGTVRSRKVSRWTCTSYLGVSYGNEVRVTLLVFHLMQTYSESFFPTEM